MRIVVTVHTYWPDRNGVQYVTQYLCEGLAAKGHEVTVITTVSDPHKAVEEEHNSVRIIRVFLKTRYSVFNFGVKAYRTKVLEEVKSADWIINCCVQSPANNVLLPVMKRISAKKMLYMHGMHEFKLPKGNDADLKYKLWHLLMNIRWRLFYAYNKCNFQLYNAIVDIHETSPGLRFMGHLGVRAEQFIITNAVEDFGKICVSQKDIEQCSTLSMKYFLNVANFNDRKNQVALVEAFRRLDDKRNSKLVLVGGSSPYSDSLKAKVKEYCLQEDVFVYENQERQVTRKLIKNCFCGVMSSRFEVYPIFLCEVISCGHPYISTNVGCVSDIPGGDIAQSEEELSEMMWRMLTDDAHRNELESEGNAFAVRHLSQQSKIDQLEKILLSKQ